MMDEQFFDASLRAMQRATARLSQGIPDGPLDAIWRAILDFVAQSLQQKGEESSECLVIEMTLIGPRAGELAAKKVSDVCRIPWTTCRDDNRVLGNLRLLFDQVRVRGGNPIPVHEADCNSGVGFYLTARQAALLGRVDIGTESATTTQEKI